MSDKPTHEELTQGVKDLEKKVIELARAEEKFAKVFHASPLLMIISAIEDGKLIEVNDNFVHVTGYSREEAIGTTSANLGLISQEDRNVLKNELRTTNHIHDMELTLKKKNGETIYCLYSGEIITAEGKQRLLSLAKDISGRKQAEEKLQEAHDKLELRVEERTAELVRANHNLQAEITERKRIEEKVKKLGQQNELILNSAGEGIFGLDTEGRHTFVNPTAAKILGYTTEELIGRQSHTLIHHTRADGRPYTDDKCPIYQAFKDGRIHHKDDEIFWRKNGLSFPVDYTSTPMFEGGELVGAVVSFLDITFRKQAEEQLRESEERYRSVYNSAPLAFVIWDCDCKITDWNIQAQRIFGWPKEEVLGRNFFKFLIPEATRPQVDEVVKVLLKGDLSHHSINENLTKSGEVILCEWNNSTIYDNKGHVRGAISLALDITERKRTEEALTVSEKKYRSLFENANDAIFIIDPVHLTILDANENAYNRLGYSLEELRRLKINNITGSSSVSSNKSKVWELMQKDSMIFEHTQKHKDGLEIPVEISSKIINYHGRKIIQAFVRDITERKQDQEKLRKSAEKIQHFAYSVAHDLKNPSIAIYGLTKRLQKNFGDSLNAKGKSYCEQIQKSSEQIAALVETINLYIATKERPLCLEEVNSKEILQIIHEEFSAQFNIRQINMFEPEDIPAIQADKLSMLRVFRNFVDNALKYGGDTLSKVEIGYKDVDDFHIFSVSDDGVGLKKEESKGIFGLFKRKETSRGIEGTGLGLAIVKEIAERHQGKVWIEPGSKKGVTFNMSISKFL